MQVYHKCRLFRTNVRIFTSDWQKSEKVRTRVDNVDQILCTLQIMVGRSTTVELQGSFPYKIGTVPMVPVQKLDNLGSTCVSNFDKSGKIRQ